MRRTAPFAALSASALLASCAPVVPPGPVSAAAAEARIGQTVRLDGRTVSPLSIVEDSRCPASVQCIQAGTVRLRVRISEGGNEDIVAIGLAKPVALNRAWLHLVDVCPGRATPDQIAEDAYLFTFALSASEKPPSVKRRCS
ncbi:MAG: hypothetical protein H0W74_12735 [Sphingosinicella sp.]|nr:hypothetical protein [Sphingosinicella sp.]